MTGSPSARQADPENIYLFKDNYGGLFAINDIAVMERFAEVKKKKKKNRILNL